MKFFIITGFINAICCGSCCLFVLLNNFKSKTAKSFALFNCIVALWAFFYFLSMLASQLNEALFYSRTLNTIAIYIPPVFLYFCMNITENQNIIFKRILLMFSFLDLFLLPFVPTKYFIPTMQHKLLFQFWPVDGPLFHLSTIQYLILIPLGLYLLKNKLNRSSGDNKIQFKILFYTLLISFIGGGTNYFPCLNIPIPPYGNALVPIFILGFIYLIFKYQIMGIKISFSRSFAYTILIFFITFFYFLATYLTDKYLNALIGYKSFIFSFIAASITALAFIPLKDNLQIFIDKYFFKKSIKEIEEENELLREEVTQSDRMKSIAILASGMAHEIKNPLTPIKTFSEELPRRLGDKNFLLKFSKIISKEVNRIDDLVQELLNYAKPSTPHLTSTNIHQLIEHTLDLLNNDLIRHKIHSEISFKAQKPITRIDRKQMQQALLNIFLNAIEAMPDGGNLNIVTETQNDLFTINISDTGRGIDPKDLPHIFEPFFSKKDNGTGLGLAITKGIIEKHGGKIIIESHLNQGTTFKILI